MDRHPPLILEHSPGGVGVLGVHSYMYVGTGQMLRITVALVGEYWLPLSGVGLLLSLFIGWCVVGLSSVTLVVTLGYRNFFQAAP